MKDEVIKKLIDYIDGSKDFLLDQAPQMFKEMIKYEYLVSILEAIFFLILISSAIYILYLSITNPARDKYDSRSYENLLGIVIPSILIVPLILGFWNGMTTAIQIKMAPKYFLLEKILEKGKE